VSDEPAALRCWRLHGPRVERGATDE
jgi:hypothetical protein